MDKIRISMAELATVAVTRGLLGAGVGLLLADHLRDDTRRRVGLALTGLGALSTIPLALDIFGRRRIPAPTRERLASSEARAAQTPAAGDRAH